MSRDPRLYLDDIVDAVEKIRRYTEGLDYDSFEQDEKTLDAVVRNLEIVGEAAGHLPADISSQAPEIEWRKIVGLRNVLSHAYFAVSLPLVWDVVQNKLEPLRDACTQLIKYYKEKTP